MLHHFCHNNYTDSSHEQRDLQHFMSEQIDLYNYTFFKAITAASCVDICC